MAHIDMSVHVYANLTWGNHVHSYAIAAPPVIAPMSWTTPHDIVSMCVC